MSRLPIKKNENPFHLLNIENKRKQEEKEIKKFVREEIRELLLNKEILSDADLFFLNECKPFYEKIPKLKEASILKEKKHGYEWGKSKKSLVIIFHKYGFCSWKKLEKYITYKNSKPGNLKQTLNEYLNTPLSKGKLPRDWDSISRFFPDITL